MKQLQEFNYPAIVIKDFENVSQNIWNSEDDIWKDVI